MCPSDLERDLEDLEADLATARSAVESAERAEFEHRVADRPRWRWALAAKRRRVRELSAERGLLLQRLRGGDGSV